MKLKRRIDTLLSRGHGAQLIWLAIILLVLFFSFWGFSALVFREEGLEWQDIAALILDAGSFGGAGHHDFFRLILTILGAIIFAALLINVIGNIFENVIESHNKGELRYSFRNHVLILGNNSLLPSMILRLLQDITPEKDIVVMTSSPVDPLRASLEASIGKSNLKAFRSRVTFYHDDRNNKANLERACARMASLIYILGEENEPGHDSINISCLKQLEGICEESSHPVRCIVTMESSTSADILHYVSKPIIGETSRKQLLVDIINVNEYVAEQTLLGGSLPFSFNEAKILPIDGVGQKNGEWDAVRFVIAGMSPMGIAMAKTAAQLCHFGSSKGMPIHSVITFVQNEIRPTMEMIVAEIPWLFRLSHYVYIRPGEAPVVHYPDPEYGDFLDIKWEFIDANLSSPEVRKMLSDWANEPGMQLSLALCYSSDDENLSSAIHLPRNVYKANTPIYIHQTSCSDMLEFASSTRQFGNLFNFGAGTASDKDPLMTSRSVFGQRVNYVYSRLYGGSVDDPETLWYSLKEADKLSSIYNANSIPIKIRSKSILRPGTVLDMNSVFDLCRVEHARWMVTELLLGFKPYSIAERKRLIARVYEECSDANRDANNGVVTKDQSPTWKQICQEKKLNFTHIDIAPFNELIDEEEKLKDINMLVNIPYILGETSDIYRYDSSDGTVVRICS